MPTPLLETKLYLPRPRAGSVPRPRLAERLDGGVAAKLILVSAPAGFGKTTLLAEWLGQGSGSRDAPLAAWLSLDRGDNEPGRFWTYVIAALRTVASGIGESEVALLASPQPPPITILLTTLLNEVGGLRDDVVLVLDDYHLIESREIHDAIEFLVDNAPPNLHVLIASRADPAIPLARLRARGDLVEVRAADLRFTAEEAAGYLNGAMGLHLTAADVAALDERTEGWIAALQLAALSMQGRDDVGDFISGFRGDDRYIVDYLAEEVLHRQPAGVRDFLLRTSLLGRLNGALCDAVLDQSGGRVMLETLDRANLFVVPLDDRREWYRYHHLFADVLRARLSDESPELVQGLHRRASDWYAANGDRYEAIRHAMLAEDFGRAADLVELVMPALRRDRLEGQFRRWLEMLPEDQLLARPVLSNGFAGALLSTGETEGVEQHLLDAERWLDTEADTTGMVVVVEEEFRRLPAWIAIHRAGLALQTGHPDETMLHARRALSLLEESDDLGRGAAHALTGLASWGSGDIETGLEAYVECLGNMQRAGHFADVMGVSIAVADLQTTQGRLREAVRTFEKALDLNPQSGPVLRGTGDMYVGLSVLHFERSELLVAKELLLRSDELGEHLSLAQNPYRWRVAMARIMEIEGDAAGAERLLDEAERVYVGDFSPAVHPVPAVRARLWIRQGRLADATQWAEQRGLSALDDLAYVHEYEHVTLVRLLLARQEVEGTGDLLNDASELLARLLADAEAGKRAGSVIEILTLQALALARSGGFAAARGPLERALDLGEPENYVRTFVDEGHPMVALLRSVEPESRYRSYVERLLHACDGSEDRTAPTQDLVDPLSQRELVVLRLLGTELTGPEIARELVVSLNTVRTHTKNIYAKLGVTSRRAACRRAEELHLG